MITAETARKILKRSLQPKKLEIESHMEKIQKKIKLAAKLKMSDTDYEVIGDMMSVEQSTAIAITVALKLKNKGFAVKIRRNQIKVSWDDTKKN